MYTIVHPLNDITAAHIHNGTKGNNGPVLITFSTLVSPILGKVVLSQDQAKLLYTGGLYVNLHTASKPGGYLRGQIGCFGTCTLPKKFCWFAS